MKKLFVVLFSLLIATFSYADNPETNVSNMPSVLEELSLKGQYCTGKGGYWGSWKTLYLNSNQVGKDEEVLIQLDLDGATLTQWEFDAFRGDGTVYVSELNLNSGVIRFNPRTGSVITFAYTLEKGGSVKVGYCSFLIR